MDKKLNIIYKDPSKLKMYKNNPRKNQEAVPYVKKSIEEFGFKIPLIIDKDDEIICGHTRVLASLELGLKEVPCIVADDLTDEQIKAFRLADNKVSEKAEWDFDLLDEELQDIIDINMEDLGFLNINEDIETEDNEYETEELKENKIKLHICPECGCEFED